jgi:hypothetical protein
VKCVTEYADSISNFNPCNAGDDNILTDSRIYCVNGYITFCICYDNSTRVGIEPLSIKSIFDYNNRIYGRDNIDSISTLSNNYEISRLSRIRMEG